MFAHRVNNKRSKCRNLVWSLKDEHYRGIILGKFLFWMIKPALIASTKSNSLLNNIVDVTFVILLFITTTTLSYITFNKHYKYLNKLYFIKNNKYFVYLYTFNYIITIITTYSIVILVTIFKLYVYTENKNDTIQNIFNWQYIVYPPCLWLLVTKLYFNEISNIINIIDNYNKQYKLRLNNINYNSKLKIIEFTNRLFMFQIFIIIGLIVSIRIQINYVLCENNMLLHHPQGRLSCKEEYNRYYRSITGKIIRYVGLSS